MPLDDDYKTALTYYVKNALEKDTPRSEIKQELRDQGCDESEVQSVLRLGDEMFLNDLSKPKTPPRFNKKMKLIAFSAVLIFLLLLSFNQYGFGLVILAIAWLLVRKQQRELT